MYRIKDNRKEVGTVLLKMAQIEPIEESSGGSSSGGTEVNAGGVKDEKVVFGFQGNALSKHIIPVDDSKEGGAILPLVVKLEPFIGSLKDELEVRSSCVNSELTVFRSKVCGVSEYGERVKTKQEDEDKNEITLRCCNAMRETHKFEKFSSNSKNTNPLISLGVKIEKENESEITHCLVPYFCGREVHEDRKSLQQVKHEVDCGSIKEENNSYDSEIRSDDVVSVTHVSNEQNEAKEKPRKESGEIYYDLSSAKLLQVRVELEDLFPSYVRKLGEAHLNNGSCSCLYCRGEYKFSTTFRHLSETLEKPPLSSTCDNFVNPKYQQGSSLKIHTKVQSEKKLLQCDMCSQKCSGRYALETHVRLHTKKKPFKCQQCSAKFSQQCGLKRHMSTHSGERPFKCAQCPASFKYKDSLRVHFRSHSGEKPFECKLCPLKFATRTNLKNHVRVHTGEKPYSCKFCPKKFTQSSSLNAHIKNVHSDVRPFKCKLCPAKFKQSGYMKCHLKFHSGERPFECKLCPEKFKQKSALNVHLRVHSGERPFKCKLCPAKFKQIGALNLHLKTVHCGEKPLSCAHCSARFRFKPPLAYHLKRFHADVNPLL